MKSRMNIVLLLFSFIFLIASCKKDKDPENTAPVANNVSVTGSVQAGQTLTASYVYTDAEDDFEGTSTYQWYAATDANGAGEAVITGATTSTYLLQEGDEGKFIRVGVKPVALTGTLIGSEVKSSFTSAVEEATSVTFTYNGATVTYGILISPTTQRRWMDRNLGAPNTPSAVNDWANYGDLFQWGRSADGHQLTIRGDSYETTSSVNGTTASVATTANAGTNLFITSGNSPYDWLNPQNNNLWQGDTRVNNPCPTGWHIPSEAEWIAEGFDNDNAAAAFQKLKITLGGFRTMDGFISDINIYGGYWSSTVENGGGIGAKGFVFWSSYTLSPTNEARAVGFLCRCIKDN